jgi:serine/threonine-protein kinase
MYRKAIGLQPGDWTTYNALGWFLFQNGRYTEATEQYRKIISIDSTNVRGYENLGSALTLSGDFEEAAAAFLRAIEIQPSGDAYSNLGLLYYYLGQTNDAVLAHREAIRLTPNDHLAWANLGDALSFNGSMKPARDAFAKAENLAEGKLAVNPVDAGTLIDLSWIKAMLGETDEARRLISRARDITPGDPYLHFYSALISVRMGERTAVFEELQAAVDLGYPLELLAAEPHLRSIRNEPRFEALSRQQVVDQEPVTKARSE